MPCVTFLVGGLQDASSPVSVLQRDGDPAAIGRALLREWEAEGQPERGRGGVPRFGRCGGRIEVSLEGGPDACGQEPDARTPQRSAKECATGVFYIHGHPQTQKNPTGKDPTGRSQGQGTKTPLSGRAIWIGEPVSGGQGGYEAVQCAHYGADYGTGLDMICTVPAYVTRDAEPGHSERARSRAHEDASPDSTPSFFLAHQRARAQGEREPPEEHTANPKDRQSPLCRSPCGKPPPAALLGFCHGLAFIRRRGHQPVNEKATPVSRRWPLGRSYATSNYKVTNHATIDAESLENLW